MDKLIFGVIPAKDSINSIKKLRRMKYLSKTPENQHTLDVNILCKQ